METQIGKLRKRMTVNNIIMLTLMILVITGVIFYYEMKTKMLVGGMYVRDEKAAEVMLQELFSNSNTYSNLEMAEEAVVKGGYTQKAFQYLFWISEKKYIVIVSVVLIVVVMTISIWNNGIVLQREIREIKSNLIRENEELKKDLKEENEYIKRRNIQLQNFTENIAHQIKTPLTALCLKLELLGEKLEEDNSRLEECFFQINRIKEFVKRLLVTSRMESGKVNFKKETINVKELIEEVVEATAFKENITCTYRLPENYTIQGDNDWLCEGILNVIVNGLESVEGKEDKQIYVDVVEDNGKCIITVSDNGEGFGERNLSRLFDRFESDADAKAFNMGIGLNLSMLIVKAHYGKIFVENSQQYGGASFRIILPQYKLKENF